MWHKQLSTALFQTWPYIDELYIENTNEKSVPF